MALEQIYFLSQIIAATAIVVSLVYLATQVRQSTQAVRASTVHDVEESIRAGYSQAGRSAEVGAILVKGAEDLSALTRPERVVYYGIWHNLLRSYEDAFFQTASGALDARLWSALERQLADLFSSSGIQGYWRDRRHWYTDVFKQYIDDKVTALAVARDFRPGGS